MSNPLLKKGQEVAQFCYQSQRYFHQFFDLVRGIAKLLQDKGWKIVPGYYSEPLDFYSWSWKTDRSVMPRMYLSHFYKENCPAKRYNFFIFFSNTDPSDSGLSWVPMACFLMASQKDFNYNTFVNLQQKILPVIQLHLLRDDPVPSSIFIETSPEFYGDNAIDKIESISMVPFPLVAIETIDSMEKITEKAIAALEKGDADLLIKDPEYLELAWGIKAVGDLPS